MKNKINQNNWLDLLYFILVVLMVGTYPFISLEDNIFVLLCCYTPLATFTVAVFKKRKPVSLSMRLWCPRLIIRTCEFKFYKSCALCRMAHRNPDTVWRHKIFTCKRKDGLIQEGDPKPERSCFQREEGCLWHSIFPSQKCLKENDTPLLEHCPQELAKTSAALMELQEK